MFSSLLSRFRSRPGVLERRAVDADPVVAAVVWMRAADAWERTGDVGRAMVAELEGAVVAIEERQAGLAQRLAQRVLYRDPRNPQAYLLLARAARIWYRDDEASEAFVALAVFGAGVLESLLEPEDVEAIRELLSRRVDDRDLAAAFPDLVVARVAGSGENGDLSRSSAALVAEERVVVEVPAEVTRTLPLPVEVDLPESIAPEEDPAFARGNVPVEPVSGIELVSLYGLLGEMATLDLSAEVEAEREEPGVAEEGRLGEAEAAAELGLLDSFGSAVEFVVDGGDGGTDGQRKRE